MEILTKQETMQAIFQAVAPIARELAIAQTILAKIPLTVSTNDAMAMTGIKSPHTLKKHFQPTQNGQNGRITYRLVEIERWLAERQLTKAA
jgi:hypothetical protein